MNLERQLKRHIIGRKHTFFATVAPGFEAICQRELDRMSDTIEVVSCVKGGVNFAARMVDLYCANLSLHTAGRILMRLAEFKATNFRQLTKRIGALAWHLYLPQGAIPHIKVTSRQSRLYHSQAVADAACLAIDTHWKAQGITISKDRDQTLYIRLSNDVATVSLDSSGDSLHRRGLKSHQAQAPLRETTAAAILVQAGFDPEGTTAVLDPMSGSGTFSLEAALMYKHMAPGLNRNFAFMQWPAFRTRQWNYLTNQAGDRIRKLSRPMVMASDANPKSCRLLSDCARKSGLDDAVQVRTMDFFDLDPATITGDNGLVVMNPPYGRRMTAPASIANFYRQIEAKLCKDFKSWRVALITPQTKWVSSLSEALEAKRITHGGLPLTLLSGVI